MLIAVDVEPEAAAGQGRTGGIERLVKGEREGAGGIDGRVAAGEARVGFIASGSGITCCAARSCGETTADGDFGDEGFNVVTSGVLQVSCVAAISEEDFGVAEDASRGREVDLD